MVCPKPDCRAPLAPGDEFCFNCGTDVRAITGAAAATPSPVTQAPAKAPAIPPTIQTFVLDEAAQNQAPSGEPANPAPAVNMAGPEAQPAARPPDHPPTMKVGQAEGDSFPVPSGPNGGVAANAFGAPPAPVAAPEPPAAPQPAVSQTAAPPTPKLRLHVAGPYGDEVVEWQGRELLLGRNDPKTRVFPDVNLDDSAASRRHLAIFQDDSDGKFYAQDLESANGTTLNGQDLKPGEPTTISHGDVLKIGERYSIQVRMT